MYVKNSFIFSCDKIGSITFTMFTIFKRTAQWHCCVAISTIVFRTFHLPQLKLCPHETRSPQPHPQSQAPASTLSLSLWMGLL